MGLVAGDVNHLQTFPKSPPPLLSPSMNPHQGTRDEHQGTHYKTKQVRCREAEGHTVMAIRLLAEKGELRGPWSRFPDSI